MRLTGSGCSTTDSDSTTRNRLARPNWSPSVDGLAFLLTDGDGLGVPDLLLADLLGDGDALRAALIGEADADGEDDADDRADADGLGLDLPAFVFLWLALCASWG